jgi:hypothetical protein
MQLSQRQKTSSRLLILTIRTAPTGNTVDDSMFQLLHAGIGAPTGPSLGDT